MTKLMLKFVNYLVGSSNILDTKMGFLKPRVQETKCLFGSDFERL